VNEPYFVLFSSIGFNFKVLTLGRLGLASHLSMLVLVGSFGTPYAVGWDLSLVSAPTSWWAEKKFSGLLWYMCPGLVRAS
jgi:hypothetical protein